VQLFIHISWNETRYNSDPLLLPFHLTYLLKRAGECNMISSSLLNQMHILARNNNSESWATLITHTMQCLPYINWNLIYIFIHTYEDEIGSTRWPFYSKWKSISSPIQVANKIHSS